MGLLDSRAFFGGPLEPRRYVEFAMSTQWYARRIKIIVGGVKIERRYSTYALWRFPRPSESQPVELSGRK